MLIAFNAAPGTVSPDNGNGYGPYAKALSEMIREGGRTPADLFDRVRLRVNELTKGAQVPWDTSDIEAQFMFFERGPGAPSRADSPERLTGQVRYTGDLVLPGLLHGRLVRSPHASVWGSE